MANTVYCKVEQPTKSKNNRIYGVIALISFLATKEVYLFINGWLEKLELPGIPSGAITVSIQVLCVLGYIIRTYFTTVCAPPGPVTGDTDVYLNAQNQPMDPYAEKMWKGPVDENGKPYQVVRGTRE